MDTEYLVVDDDAKCEEVEHVRKVMPHIGVAIFPRAFGVEAVRLRHASGFVVTADQMHAIRVSKLQADKKRDGFNAEHPAIHIITWWRET